MLTNSKLIMFGVFLALLTVYGTVLFLTEVL